MHAEHDLGTIVRARYEQFILSHTTTASQRKALRAIAACRTPALGGERQRCDRCGYEHMQWHSCRSRCCPRCQGAARAEWVEARRSELLPVPYFHVVFTVPEPLNIIARRRPRLFYDLLFRAAARTLTDIARTRLHVHIGALAVLHTWSQTLILHPHIHCVVPGGGFSAERRRWLNVRKPTFFLPVRVLSRRFRTVLCTMLAQSSATRDMADLDALLATVRGKEWVVYAKPPFGGPEQVLAYLANYTHRIAISNARIAGFDGQHLTFRYRDSAALNTHRLMSLEVDEFIRRFLLHVPPARFVRIRYYGFMANRARTANIAYARALIAAQPPARSPLPPRHLISERLCPRCQLGRLHTVEQLQPLARHPAPLDTS